MKEIGFMLISLVCVGLCANIKQVAIKLEKELNDAVVSSIIKCVPEGGNIRDFTTVIERGEVIEDDTFKKFIHCGFKESGYSNEDGTVKAELKSKAFPEPEVVYKVILECNKFRGDNPLDTTFNYFKCFQQKSPYVVSFETN